MAEQAQELIPYLVQVHFVLKSWDENKYEAVYAAANARLAAAAEPEEEEEPEDDI